MIGFDPTADVSESVGLSFPITITASTTTEVSHTLEVIYADGIGNATVTTYPVFERTGFDAAFGDNMMRETYIFPKETIDFNIFLTIVNDFIVETTEFFRLSIASLTSDEGSPATCQVGDAEQYRCNTDIFILDDDCKSWKMLCE